MLLNLLSGGLLGLELRMYKPFATHRAAPYSTQVGFVFAINALATHTFFPDFAYKKQVVIFVIAGCVGGILQGRMGRRVAGP